MPNITGSNNLAERKGAAENTLMAFGHCCTKFAATLLVMADD